MLDLFQNKSNQNKTKRMKISTMRNILPSKYWLGPPQRRVVIIRRRPTSALLLPSILLFLFFLDVRAGLGLTPFMSSSASPSSSFSSILSDLISKIDYSRSSTCKRKRSSSSTMSSIKCIGNNNIYITNNNLWFDSSTSKKPKCNAFIVSSTNPHHPTLGYNPLYSQSSTKWGSTPRQRKREFMEPLGSVAARGFVSPPSMISSFFNWNNNNNNNNNGEDTIPVQIETPASNSRRISASVVINRPINDVWRILTDYDNLCEYVPNLVESRTIPRPTSNSPADAAKVRLYQEGAQRIVGFQFKASVTMDMEEVLEGEFSKLGQRSIKFKLVDSMMFSDFSGEWRLQCYSRIKANCDNGNGGSVYTYSTKLFYYVTVKPKGPVPVGALEWRIREDIPLNLKAVKRSTENLPWDCANLLDSNSRFPAATTGVGASSSWLADETLGAYIPPSSSPTAAAAAASSSNTPTRAATKL